MSLWEGWGRVLSPRLFSFRCPFTSGVVYVLSGVSPVAISVVV